MRNNQVFFNEIDPFFDFYLFISINSKSYCPFKLILVEFTKLGSLQTILQNFSNGVETQNVKSIHVCMNTNSVMNFYVLKFKMHCLKKLQALMIILKRFTPGPY